MPPGSSSSSMLLTNVIGAAPEARAASVHASEQKSRGVFAFPLPLSRRGSKTLGAGSSSSEVIVRSIGSLSRRYGVCERRDKAWGREGLMIDWVFDGAGFFRGGDGSETGEWDLRGLFLFVLMGFVLVLT